MSKTGKWSSLIHELRFLKERRERLNWKRFREQFLLKRGRSSNAAYNAIFDALKINIIWFSSDTAFAQEAIARGESNSALLPADANAAADNCE